MAKICEETNCQFYHNKRGCPSCVLNPDSYVAKLQAEVKRLEEELVIQGKLGNDCYQEGMKAVKTVEADVAELQAELDKKDELIFAYDAIRLAKALWPLNNSTILNQYARTCPLNSLVVLTHVCLVLWWRHVDYFTKERRMRNEFSKRF